MFVRKTLASFLIFLFVLVSLPAFYLQALNRTFFAPEFYSDVIVQETYDVLVDKSAKSIVDASEMLQVNFSLTEIKDEIAAAYSVAMFKDLMVDFSQKMRTLKGNPEANISLSLKELRNSLQTVSNNIAYKYYKKLPSCVDEKKSFINAKGYPICVPENVDYEDVINPIIEDVDLAIFKTIPEELDNINSIIPGSFLRNAEIYTDVLFVTLVILLIMIAFVLMKPLSLIVQFESLAIFIAGLFAGVLAFFNAPIMSGIINSTKLVEQDAEVLNYIDYLLSFLGAEIMRMSLLFVVAGIALLIIHFFLKKVLE